eukprot:CAMPEP_0119502932 /NCGR_PEP_ID=MMETSP1344-20130328/24246_1 /TAXON_ID=236787 /ORGANISM="Florenciella parvula, Strain CCMP2471" /LENGTH=76 /DNA_ID=CAMNT_0007539171 /DNA_START=448 /DNA_END=674 /DNA_ORIENTATION=-
MARGQFEKVVIDDARKPGPIVGTVDEVRNKLLEHRIRDSDGLPQDSLKLLLRRQFRYHIQGVPTGRLLLALTATTT